MFDATINWEMWSAIGTILGAVATFAAVAVALIQTYRMNGKKIKVSVELSIALLPLDFSKPPSPMYCVSVNISNVGQKRVKIQSWGVLTKEKLHILLSNLSPINENLPYILEPEDSLTLNCPHNCFKDLVKEIISKKELNPKKHIKFVVIDAAGKRYIVKTKETASEALKLVDKTKDSS